MFLYLFWSLLPLAYLYLTVKAQWKKTFKMQGRENPKEYFSQFAFTAVTLWIAILIDQSVLESIVRPLALGLIDPEDAMMVASWGLYPAALLVGFYIQKLMGFDPDRHKRIDDKRRNAGLPMSERR